MWYRASMVHRKEDRDAVAHVTIGVRVSGWERVGLDELAARETTRLHGAGVPSSFTLAPPALLRQWAQREIAAAGLDVDELKRKAAVAYPPPAPVRRPPPDPARNLFGPDNAARGLLDLPPAAPAAPPAAAPAPPPPVAARAAVTEPAAPAPAAKPSKAPKAKRPAAPASKAPKPAQPKRPEDMTADEVRALVDAANVTQADLAGDAGINPGTVSNFMTGKTDSTPETRGRLAAAARKLAK
jgi:hypothetical protein